MNQHVVEWAHWMSTRSTLNGIRARLNSDEDDGYDEWCFSMARYWSEKAQHESIWASALTSVSRNDQVART